MTRETDKRGLMSSEEEIKAAPKIVTNEDKSENVVAEGITFSMDGKVDVFCWNSAMAAEPLALDKTTADIFSNGCCDKIKASNFLKKVAKMSAPGAAGGNGASPSVLLTTIIGCYGNGTLHPLSMDYDLFEQTMGLFKPRQREKTKVSIRSIHGVFAKFIEHGDPGNDPPDDSLFLIYSSPKAPVREILCAMLVTPSKSLTTCLLIDANKKDLKHTIDMLSRSQASLDLRHPAAFLSVLLKECGYTSEFVRSTLDNEILGAEVQTQSTPWFDPGKTLIKWPDNFYSATSVLHLCQNKLMFVERAVNFDIDAWEWLRKMVEVPKTDSHAKLELFQQVGKASDAERQTILDEVDFEIVHTKSRKAQIGGLKARVDVQINLITNLIAHRESSQTNLIAILALFFAPASLIASIYSAGIFATDENSWVSYTASTVPITFATLAIGLSFLERQRIIQAWQSANALLGGAPATKVDKKH